MSDFMNDTPAVQNEPGGISADEKNMAVLAHLLGLFTLFIAPLIIWIMNKEKGSAYVEKHAKEALNYQITMAALYFCAKLLCFILIGFLVLPILVIIDIIFVVNAVVAARDGKEVKYPFNFNLIQ